MSIDNIPGFTDVMNQASSLQKELNEQKTVYLSDVANHKALEGKKEGAMEALQTLKENLASNKRAIGIHQVAEISFIKARDEINSGEQPARALLHPPHYPSPFKKKHPTIAKAIGAIIEVKKQILSLQATSQVLSHQITGLERKIEGLTDEINTLNLKLVGDKTAFGDAYSQLTDAIESIAPLYFKPEDDPMISQLLGQVGEESLSNPSTWNKIDQIVDQLQSRYETVLQARNALEEAFKTLTSSNNQMGSLITAFSRLNSYDRYSGSVQRVSGAQNSLDKTPKTIEQKVCTVTGNSGDVACTDMPASNPKYGDAQNALSSAQNALTQIQDDIWKSASPLTAALQSVLNFQNAFTSHTDDLPFCDSATTLKTYFTETFIPLIENTMKTLPQDETSLFANNGASLQTLSTFAANNTNWSDSQISKTITQMINLYNNIWNDPACKTVPTNQTDRKRGSPHHSPEKFIEHKHPHHPIDPLIFFIDQDLFLCPFCSKTLLPLFFIEDTTPSITRPPFSFFNEYHTKLSLASTQKNNANLSASPPPEKGAPNQALQEKTALDQLFSNLKDANNQLASLILFFSKKNPLYIYQTAVNQCAIEKSTFENSASTQICIAGYCTTSVDLKALSSYKKAERNLATTKKNIWSLSSSLRNPLYTILDFHDAFTEHTADLPFCDPATTLKTYFTETFAPLIQNTIETLNLPKEASTFFQQNGAALIRLNTFATKNKDWKRSPLSAAIAKLCTLYEKVKNDPKCQGKG